MEKSIKELLAERDKQFLDDLAEGLSGMTFYGTGSDPTVRELNPDLTEEELDYVMSKYTGGLQRG